MYTLRLSAANSQITLSEFTSSSSILSFLFPSPLCNVHKVNDLDSSPTLPENIKKMFEDISILAGWSMNILPLIPPQWLFQSVLFYPEKEICPQARFCSSFSLTLHSCLVWIRAVQLSLSPSSLVVSISYVLSSHDMRCECLIHPQHGHSCRYHTTLSSAQVHSHLCRMFLRPSMFLIYISLYCKWIVVYA